MLDDMPATFDVLRNRAFSSVPSVELRYKNVPLNPHKLPTSRTATLDTNDSPPTQDMFFLNPLDLVKTILSSSLISHMHFGLAVMVDRPTAFWHSSAWAQSIRTTSGEFAKYPVVPGRPESSRKPIFPSDFVRFRCTTVKPCRCKGMSPLTLHWGRVREVWREGRRGLGCGIKVVISRIVQLRSILNSKEVLNLPKAARLERSFPEGDLNLDCEYVILAQPLETVPEENVVEELPYDIALDTAYGSSVDNLPGDILTSTMTWPSIFIRQVFHESSSTFYPLCQTDPIVGELEVAHYGRQQLEEKLAGKLPVKCVPTTIFNDGFGLYRHMHKSIEGVYIFLANLEPREGNSQVNVFPLTLGPHGCNFRDVVEAISPHWRTLEEGLEMTLKGERTMVYAFNIAFRADMPQQQDNAGMLRQCANHGCRDCDVTKEERGFLNVQWVLPPHRRTHYEVKRQRQCMDMKTSKAEKTSYGASVGMASQPPALEMWSPALDVLRSRPSDAAHSEFAGITKMTHTILIEQVCIIGSPRYFLLIAGE